MNYNFSYDSKVSTRPVDQVNSVNVTLEIVTTDYVCTGNCCVTDFLGVTILLSIHCEFDIDFQARVFR